MDNHLAGCQRPTWGAAPRFEVATIARAHGAAVLERHGLGPEQRQALRAMTRCRTAALGGHLQVCDGCGHSRPSYNSCRNRHCPKCQSLAQHRWLKARQQRILPTHHFHVVFTLPAELRPLVMNNRRALYGLLFATAPACLLQLGLDPARLGAQLGLSAVLHTWSRDLGFHPHLHCVVTGGGLSADTTRWVGTRRGFLFPVRVLSSLFAGKFLDGLRRLYDSGKLKLRAGCAELSEPQSFRRLLNVLQRKRWVVYLKPPFGDVRAVYAYLGRYTHRVGISNRRLLHVDAERVTFQTRHDKKVRLHGVEFLRRLMLHVLPKGFVRIRHYGLLAPGNVHGRLQRAHDLLSTSPAEDEPDAETTPIDDSEAIPAERNLADYQQLYRALTGIDLRRCPACRTGTLHPQPLPSGPGPP